MNSRKVLAVASGRAAVEPASRLHLTDRGRVVFALLAAVPLTFGAVLLGSGFDPGVGAADASSHSGAALRSITVKQGDTLWSIAKQLAPTRDPRDVVAELGRVNALTTGVIQPGQRLLVSAEFGAGS